MAYTASKRSLFLLFFLTLCIYSEQLVDIHGFVSQGYFASSKYGFLTEDSQDGSWEMRYVGVNFQKEFGSRFRAGLQLLSRDVGEYGNNKVVLDWAYGNVYLHDMCNISAGRVKRELSFFTSTQDFDFITPWALLPSVIYDQGIRSINSSVDGVRFNGNFNLNSAGDLSYSATIGTVDMGPESDLRNAAAILGITRLESAKLKYLTSLNLIYSTPIDGLRLLFTHSYGHDLIYEGAFIEDKGVTVNNDERLNWFYSGIQYQHPFIEVTSEAHVRHHDVKRHITQVYVPQLESFIDTDIHTRDTVVRAGGYVGLMVKPLDWFNVGGYYQLYWDRVNQNRLDADKITLNDPANVNRDGALTLAFKVNDDLVIKLEGHLVYGTALLASGLNDKNVNSNGAFANGNYWQYGVAKVTFNF